MKMWDKEDKAILLFFLFQVLCSLSRITTMLMLRVSLKYNVWWKFCTMLTLEVTRHWCVSAMEASIRPIHTDSGLRYSCQNQLSCLQHSSWVSAGRLHSDCSRFTILSLFYIINVGSHSETRNFVISRKLFFDWSNFKPLKPHWLVIQNEHL